MHTTGRECLLFEKVIDRVGVEIGRNGVFFAQQFFFRGDTTQHQQTLQSIVGSKQDIGIQSISHHANS